MIKKILGYSLLAVVAYLTFLVVYLPAEVAWQFARSKIAVQQIPVQVVALDGTVWNGSSRLRYQSQHGQLYWHLQPWRILVGDPVIQLRLKLPEGELAGTAVTSWGGIIGVTLSGRMGVATLNPLLAPNRVSLDGALDVRDVHLRWDSRQRRVLNASGSLQWSGGTVGYPMGSEIKRQQMPGLIGLVSQRGGDLVLDVKDNPNSLGAAEVLVQEDGVAKIAVRRKLLDLAGAPWSANSDPQDVVFRIQQKLF